MVDWGFETWIGSLLRVIGVCVLFALGHVLKFFRPSSIAYSFKTIYRMEYDKNDSYKQLMERAGQQMAGTIFLGVVIVFICLIF
ncbi:MAG: hypothetical protein V4456_00115 [Bacteroidota bacterium]